MYFFLTALIQKKAETLPVPLASENCFTPMVLNPPALVEDHLLC